MTHPWWFNSIRYLRNTYPEFSGVFALPARRGGGVVWCVLA